MRAILKIHPLTWYFYIYHIDQSLSCGGTRRTMPIVEYNLKVQKKGRPIGTRFEGDHAYGYSYHNRTKIIKVLCFTIEIEYQEKTIFHKAEVSTKNKTS